MPESKDPAFKLFGTTIPVPHEITVDREEEEEEEDDDDDEQEEKDESDKIATKTKERDQRPATSLELTEPPTTSPAKENPKPPSVGKDGDTEVKSEQSISQEKTLKKPDKILPCPRCNSQDTKFCYYNNYNVNQPRHFCKNCQRYWTAGGTMRNVPVGAGRRKSKNTPSHYRHIAVANAFQTGRTDQTESIYHPSLKPNGTILTFSSDPPLSESVASGLNLADKTAWNCNKSGFIRTEEQRVPVSCGENGDEKSSGSSVTASDPFEEGKGTNPQEPTIRNCQGFSPQVPSFTNPPWIHPYNSAQWRPPLLPPPPFCASTFPVPFYPTTGYWGCPIPGAWNGIPWLSPQPSSPNFGSGSSSNSLNLGKHSRDGNMLKQSNSEKEDTVRESDSERCLWIPKTLRIDDQGEAARSSIWATLGIKYDKADTNGGGGFFKSFDSKVEKKNSTAAETSPALHVNPAALSRSLNFHERS